MKPGMTRREDYRKRIYTLSGKGEVRGADLADELNVKIPTVCIYLKKLVELGDITMDRHRCVFLTEQGRAIANMLRIPYCLLYLGRQDAPHSRSVCKGMTLR